MDKEMLKKLAEKCISDRKFIPEIKTGEKDYRYIRDHKSGGERSYIPDCDIVWERIKRKKG